jgi:hypothetical protein
MTSPRNPAGPRRLWRMFFICVHPCSSVAEPRCGAPNPGRSRLFDGPPSGFQTWLCAKYPAPFCLALAAIFCTSCSRAPSFDILGSFFPAWLFCLALGVVLTAAAYGLLTRLHVTLVLPIVTYPSLTALFTFALWLSFFR